MDGAGLQPDGKIEAARRSREVDFCPACKSRLEFDTDGEGRALEWCSNRSCSNAVPHALVLNVALKGPDLTQRRTEAQRAKRAAQREAED